MPSTTQSEQTEPSWREKSAARCGRVGINLYARLTLGSFAVAVAAAGVTTALFYQDANAPLVISSDETTYGESLGAALGKAAQLDLRSGDRSALQALAEQTLKPGVVVSVGFRDAQDQPLAAASALHTHADDQLSRVRVPVTDEGIVWRSTRDAAQTIGHVELALAKPRAQTIAAANPVWVRFGYLCSVSFGLSSLLAALFIRTTFQPLRKMTETARRIADGELDTLAPATRIPLYQQLSIAINAVVTRVRTNQAAYDAKEAKLLAAIAELERLLANRTAQLEAANGRLSGEIAEKEDFLRAVSHDLNAPLRNIGGMVAMLLTKNKAELSADAQNRLDRIKKNVDAETDLINELLELSRIKSRQQHLTLVDTEALIWDLRGMFENDLKTRHIELILETSLPPLYGEKARLRQIFQNLIDNAIKYMGDRPTRTIRIGCVVNVAEASFYVRDSGVGIHPDDVQKVFFVFRRGRGELTQKIPGKGVGLASVKSIVETYAGRIWVESELDVGTTFRFTINGKYVPAVSGKIPDELQGQSVPTPALASTKAA